MGIRHEAKKRQGWWLWRSWSTIYGGQGLPTISTTSWILAAVCWVYNIVLPVPLRFSGWLGHKKHHFHQWYPLKVKTCATAYHWSLHHGHSVPGRARCRRYTTALLGPTEEEEATAGHVEIATGGSKALGLGWEDRKHGDAPGALLDALDAFHGGVFSGWRSCWMSFPNLSVWLSISFPAPKSISSLKVWKSRGWLPFQCVWVTSCLACPVCEIHVLLLVGS